MGIIVCWLCVGLALMAGLVENALRDRPPQRWEVGAVSINNVPCVRQPNGWWVIDNHNGTQTLCLIEQQVKP